METDFDALLDDILDDFVENDVSKEIENFEISSLKVIVIGDDSKDRFCSAVLRM